MMVSRVSTGIRPDPAKEGLSPSQGVNTIVVLLLPPHRALLALDGGLASDPPLAEMYRFSAVYEAGEFAGGKQARQPGGTARSPPGLPAFVVRSRAAAA